LCKTIKSSESGKRIFHYWKNLPFSHRLNAYLPHFFRNGMKLLLEPVIEFASSATCVVSIWLNTKRNSTGWPIGLVSVGLASWVYFRTGLFAECGLQVFYFLSGIYGWWQWENGKSNEGSLLVRRIPASSLWFSLLAAFLGFGLLFGFLKTISGSSQPFLDSIITAFSIVAQIWLARRWIENWVLWIFINLVSICLYVHKELWFFSALYGILLLLAVKGYFDWKKGEKQT